MTLKDIILDINRWRPNTITRKSTPDEFIQNINDYLEENDIILDPKDAELLVPYINKMPVNSNEAFPSYVLASAKLPNSNISINRSISDFEEPFEDSAFNTITVQDGLYIGFDGFSECTANEVIFLGDNTIVRGAFENSNIKSIKFCSGNIELNNHQFDSASIGMLQLPSGMTVFHNVVNASTEIKAIEFKTKASYKQLRPKGSLSGLFEYIRDVIVPIILDDRFSPLEYIYFSDQDTCDDFAQLMSELITEVLDGMQIENDNEWEDLYAEIDNALPEISAI